MVIFGRWVPPALLGPAFVALGCTSLLGIDGSYANGPREDGGAAGFRGLSGGPGGDRGGAGGDTPLGDGGASSTGGGIESGGAAQGGSGGAGGVTSTGGSSGAGDTAGSGGTSGAGGTAGAAGNGGGTTVPDCPAGVYVGTYTGTHRTSSSATFVAVTVGGPVTVQVTQADGGMPRMAFTFARPAPPTLPNDGLEAKATVIFDCSKNSGSGPFQSDATVTTTFIPGHGLITGDVQVSSRTETTLKGTWSEHENAVPDFAKGSGTWEATLR